MILDFPFPFGPIIQENDYFHVAIYENQDIHEKKRWVKKRTKDILDEMFRLYAYRNMT